MAHVFSRVVTHDAPPLLSPLSSLPCRKGFKVFGKDDIENMRQEYAGKGGEL
jgi:hypothetical protein